MIIIIKCEEVNVAIICLTFTFGIELAHAYNKLYFSEIIMHIIIFNIIYYINFRNSKSIFNLLL